MRQINRRTAPKVRDGKVQRKNRTACSRHYKTYYQNRPIIDRLDPGPGYRHVLLKRDVEKFIGLLPDWEELSRGLDAIVLDAGDEDCLGWHDHGVVAVCAWERQLVREWTPQFVYMHRGVLDRLGVEYEWLDGEEAFRVHWTEHTVKGFLLMHILLHELGHHHDRMTTRYKHRAGRGEDYAERYALGYADRLWDAYFDAFGY